MDSYSFKNDGLCSDLLSPALVFRELLFLLLLRTFALLTNLPWCQQTELRYDV